MIMKSEALLEAGRGLRRDDQDPRAREVVHVEGKLQRGLGVHLADRRLAAGLHDALLAQDGAGVHHEVHVVWEQVHDAQRAHQGDGVRGLDRPTGFFHRVVFSADRCAHSARHESCDVNP